MNYYTELLYLHFLHLSTRNSLLQSFATFFSVTIHRMWSSTISGTTTASPYPSPSFKPHELPCFHLATILEFSALLPSSLDTSCDLDPIPTSLLKQLIQTCSPLIHKIVFSTYLCPLESVQTNLKTAVFILFSKNPNLEILLLLTRYTRYFQTF